MTCIAFDQHDGAAVEAAARNDHNLFRPLRMAIEERATDTNKAGKMKRDETGARKTLTRS